MFQRNVYERYYRLMVGRTSKQLEDSQVEERYKSLLLINQDPYDNVCCLETGTENLIFNMFVFNFTLITVFNEIKHQT